MDDRVDAAHGRHERVCVEQIALNELDAGGTQFGGARWIAHERADLGAALGESFGESASDLPGRSRDEDFHAPNVRAPPPRRLEKTDTVRANLARPSRAPQNRFVHVAHRHRIAPDAATASAIAALFVDERECDVAGIAIPRSEAHLVVRFGPSTVSGLDVHAFGGQQRVHRKLLRSGQRAVTARLLLGAHEAVLGAPASAIAGRIVRLEDLWGDAAAQRLCHRLAAAPSSLAAAAVLESAIAERLVRAPAPRGNAQLAVHASEKLTRMDVKAVAVDLGISDRHLRRVFREAIGVSPKAFAKLARFQRALRAARADDGTNWASIATAVGYYDQAHLIAEFHAIAGVTPQALLQELRAAPALR